jgi:hypothetical protein
MDNFQPVRTEMRRTVPELAALVSTPAVSQESDPVFSDGIGPQDSSPKSIVLLIILDASGVPIGMPARAIGGRTRNHNYDRNP